jgi:hypothetical protein
MERVTHDTVPIWPERHVRAIGAVLAVVTVIGFAGWVWYLESIIEPAPDGTVDVLRADFGVNCGAPKDNILHWVRSACAGEKECNLAFNWNLLGHPAPTCGSQFRVEWRCSSTGRTYSYTAPWESGMKALLSCPKQTSMIERNPLPDAAESAR